MTPVVSKWECQNDSDRCQNDPKMQAPCHQSQRNFNNLSTRSKLASFVHRKFGKIKPIFLSCNNNNLANREAVMDYSNCDYDYFSFSTDDDLTYIDYTTSTYDEELDNE